MALSHQEKASIIKFLQQSDTASILKLFADNPSKKQAILQCIVIQVNSKKCSLPIQWMQPSQANFIQLLIKEGLDLTTIGSATDSDGNTVLHGTIQTKNYDLMGKILNADINHIVNPLHIPLTDRVNRHGKSPLHLALDNKDEAAIDLLMQHNASFYFFDDDPSTCSYLDHLDVLLQNGSSMNHYYLSKVLLACRLHLSQLDVSDPKFQACLDQVAYRLIGLKKQSTEIETAAWGELLANSLSTVKHMRVEKRKVQFGNDFCYEQNYLLTHVRCLLEIYFNPKQQFVKNALCGNLIRELLTACETAKMAQEISIIQSQDSKRRWRGKLAQTHSQVIQRRARLLPKKHSFCYPSGWIDSKDEGHAFYTNIARLDEEVLEITATNIGCESPRALAIPKTKKRLPAEKKVDRHREAIISSFFTATITLATKVHRPENIAQLVKNIYLPEIFGTPITTNTENKFSEIAQNFENCIVKNYLYSLRLRLKDDYQYRLLYLFIIQMSLDRLLEVFPLDQMPSLKNIFKHIHKAEAAFEEYCFKKFKQEFGYLFANLTSDATKISEIAIYLSNMRQSTLFSVSKAAVVNPAHAAAKKIQISL